MKVWVLAQHQKGQLRRVSLELAAKAKQLGDATVIEIQAERYSALAFVGPLASQAKSDTPDLILIGATTDGRDLAPRLAARLGWAYAADCTAIAIDGTTLTVDRPMYAGKIRAKVKVTLPAVLSIRPGSFPAAADAAPPQLRRVPADTAAEKLQFVKFEPVATASKRVTLAEARTIVSAGRGMKGPENWKLVEDLADALGAATGASRAVTDAGWRPNEEQVGQTGKTVTPDLYIALGISGAIQHLAGMTSSKVIVAVNKDPDADIFKIADYGVVGDLFEFVPAFTEAVKKVRGAA
ncbi:MAG TPA: electron transfer flavoprotein subunit alpha/FixB family protein [Candidatus Limnocylindria bacterium]|nr:electron transfer flavoprotein subunit alpha/FixB family protein [Candidatus Limnocylindria bacterium]